ncbi:DUF3431 domain-containing protein [Tellurirhabdus rosea]|uniref:DUF3431 domain-containing protein n=1 Tax=Tellurirhabdus rosea TaxID=2674997 RepID=UPI00225AC9AF|nr:DUF3431 domain-containing protein [Tellurirhabdus rosea]
MNRLELVVAHYRENLNWLGNVPTASGLSVTVYDKCPDARHPGAIELPNEGREAHTYLYHLVSRYDSLAEWTVFCQGKPFDHAYNFHHLLREFVARPEAIGPFRWLGHLIDTDDAQGDRLFRNWSKNEDGRGLDLAGFHRALLEQEGPPEYTFVLGAQFAVHRDVIRQQPLRFYQHALALSCSFPDAAHCFERTWDRVFGLTGIDPRWLAGRKTVYLKPMKHQH